MTGLFKTIDGNDFAKKKKPIKKISISVMVSFQTRFKEIIFIGKMCLILCSVNLKT